MCLLKGSVGSGLRNLLAVAERQDSVLDGCVHWCGKKAEVLEVKH